MKPTRRLISILGTILHGMVLYLGTAVAIGLWLGIIVASCVGLGVPILQQLLRSIRTLGY